MRETTYRHLSAPLLTIGATPNGAGSQVRAPVGVSAQLKGVGQYWHTERDVLA